MMEFRKAKDFSQHYDTNTSKRNIGTDSKKVRSSVDSKFTSTSASTGLPNTSISNLPLEVDVDPLLKDIIFSEDIDQKRIVNRLYRDIYYNDPIGGSSVDMLSTLPFSDFTLGGVSDSKAMNVFKETIERLNCRTLMPHLSIDHLVDGAYTSSLLFNKKTSKFFDTMPHNFSDTKVESLPFYGQDPIITVRIPESVRTSFSIDTARIRSMKERLGPNLVDLLQQESIELDPISMVYIPRKSFTTGEGNSYYRRILPIWLIEKNLFRGTLVESSRRQRGILHLQLGDGDQWEPTVADMEFMTELFMSADADPLGAIIATRLGVTADEMRTGGDFWKVTDIWDSTAQFKMRALGISESFLSGESNLATADNSMTVFIESLKVYRDLITRKFFYDKVFPLVSLTNGFTVNSRGKLVRKDGLLDGDNIQANLDRLSNGSKLLVPSIHWNKSLSPEGDTSFLDMLSSLTEKGIPVPLRAMAAAGGFNLDTLLNNSDEDIDLLKRVSIYNKNMEKIKKEFGPKTESDDSGGMGGFASSDRGREMKMEARGIQEKLLRAKNSGSSVLGEGTGRQIPLGARDFGESAEITSKTRTGKKKYVHNQREANNKINNTIAKAFKHINENKSTIVNSDHVTKPK